ncbi:MAG: hypothetical protein ACFFFH_09215 [Candidatus Thorarchaeota archaeon]
MGNGSDYYPLRLFDNCVNLIQSSESIGYCRYYKEVISHCPEDCPNNVLPKRKEMKGKMS